MGQTQSTPSNEEPIQLQFGRVQLLADPEQYKSSFTRFASDELNGWIPEKEVLCGAEGRVVSFFGDRTVTIIFDDGRKFDFPFESVQAQLSVEEVRVGRVMLLQHLESYKASFARFEGEQPNGWNPEKEQCCGLEGEVVAVFRDRTVTIVFDDGAKLDFPFESIQEQLFADDNKLEIQIGQIVRVSAAADLRTSAPAAFKARFRRFPESDTLNSWSEEKEVLKDRLAIVVQLFSDRTATLLFEDMQRFDFPFEALCLRGASDVSGFLFQTTESNSQVEEESELDLQIGQIVRIRARLDFRTNEPDAFKACFGRFSESDTSNSWSQEKEVLKDRLAIVVQTFSDRTATLLFEASKSPIESLVGPELAATVGAYISGGLIQKLDFPFEALCLRGASDVSGFTFQTTDQ